jgi:hypothetical protein
MKDGVADQSYGVHVAKVAMFPETAIRSASRTAAFLESKMHKKKQKLKRERTLGAGSDGGSDGGNDKNANDMEVERDSDEPDGKRRKIDGSSPTAGNADNVSLTDEPGTRELLAAFNAKSAVEFTKIITGESITKEEFIRKVVEVGRSVVKAEAGAGHNVQEAMMGS